MMGITLHNTTRHSFEKPMGLNDAMYTYQAHAGEISQMKNKYFYHVPSLSVLLTVNVSIDFLIFLCNRISIGNVTFHANWDKTCTESAKPTRPQPKRKSVKKRIG